MSIASSPLGRSDRQLDSPPRPLTVPRARVALLSSDDPLCGIARYSAALARALGAYVDIEILGLPASVMRARAAAEGDALVAAHAARLASFDAVIIQAEWGTLGYGAKRILRRLRTLLDAAALAVVTLHTVPRPGAPDWHEIVRLRRAGRGVAALGVWAGQFYDRRLAAPRYYRLIRRAQARKQVSVIVHTPGDARLLRQDFGLAPVLHHPLAYLSPEEIARERARPAHPLRSVLPPGSYLAGLFGFIGDYKGADIAIQAMRLLPETYHLAIFGAVHPNRIADRPDPVLAGLLTLVERHALTGRVHFMGACDEAEFLAALRSCDSVVLPYRESGNSASGPASLALQLGCRVIAARTRAFLEFAAYAGERLELFDISNYIELAEKLRLPGRPVDPLTEPAGLSTAGNAETYLRAMALLP